MNGFSELWPASLPLNLHCNECFSHCLVSLSESPYLSLLLNCQRSLSLCFCPCYFLFLGVLLHWVMSQQFVSSAKPTRLPTKCPMKWCVSDQHRHVLTSPHRPTMLINSILHWSTIASKLTIFTQQILNNSLFVLKIYASRGGNGKIISAGININEIHFGWISVIAL